MCDIALEIKRQGLELPLREMSESNIYELEVDKVLSNPKIKIK